MSTLRHAAAVDLGINGRFSTDHPNSVRLMLALVDTARQELVDLTPSESELVLTLVSYLNSCPTCSTYHGYMRAAFTEDVEVVPELSRDVDAAECSERVRAIARYTIRITLDASTIGPRDRRAFLAEPTVNEGTLSDLILLCSLMAMTNRWQLGCETAAEVSRRQLCEESYMARHVGWYRALIGEEPTADLLHLVTRRYNTLKEAHDAHVMRSCPCRSVSNTRANPVCALPKPKSSDASTQGKALVPPSTECSLLNETRHDGLGEVLHSTQNWAVRGMLVALPKRKRSPSPDRTERADPPEAKRTRTNAES